MADRFNSVSLYAVTTYVPSELGAREEPMVRNALGKQGFGERFLLRSGEIRNHLMSRLTTHLSQRLLFSPSLFFRRHVNQLMRSSESFAVRKVHE